MTAIVTIPPVNFPGAALENPPVFEKAQDAALRKRRVPTRTPAAAVAPVATGTEAPAPPTKTRRVGAKAEGTKLAAPGVPVPVNEEAEPSTGEAGFAEEDKFGGEGKNASMIVAKAIREHVKVNYQMHLNAAVLQKVNGYIQTLIWKSAQRARANGRKTIKVVDM